MSVHQVFVPADFLATIRKKCRTYCANYETGCSTRLTAGYAVGVARVNDLDAVAPTRMLSNESNSIELAAR